MKQIDADEAIGLLRSMTRVLCAIGILTLVFTTVNVTRFATSRDVPLAIAVLLDPMIATALAGVLYADARLASWGMRPPAWSTTLRWGAGCTAALMNTWESLWPHDPIGWPQHADPAAVLLHLTPALLLIALTETIAAYRRTLTDLLTRPAPSADTEPPGQPDPAMNTPAENHTASHGEGSAPPLPHRSELRPGATTDPIVTRTSRNEPDAAHDTPRHPTAPPGPPPANEPAAHADVWPRAVTLDNTTRATTGKPVSVWKLRTHLRIGPQRATQLREQLLNHHTQQQPINTADGRPTSATTGPATVHTPHGAARTTRGNPLSDQPQRDYTPPA